MREYIQIIEDARQDAYSAALARKDDAFASLADLVAWAKQLGVTVDASAWGARTRRYDSAIHLTWIERDDESPAGSGAIVMQALCAYADRIHAMIELQAADEDVLPGYYEEFGFDEYEDKDADHDVRPSGPDMRRFPAPRKGRRPPAPKPVAPAPVAPRPSQPLGVLVGKNVNDARYYAITSVASLSGDASEIKNALTAVMRKARLLELTAFIVNEPEWFALAGNVQPISTDMAWSGLGPPPKNHSRSQFIQDEIDRWAQLPAKGKKVLALRKK